MGKVNPEITKLYILALKHGMKLKDVPRAWLNVEMAQGGMDPNYKGQKMPEYVKMIMKYGTKKG